MPRVLGIDPSLTSTGLAVIDDGVVTDLVRVRTGSTGHERVQDIVDAIAEAAGDPTTLVGIEGTAMHAKGSSVVQIFGLWGVITHALWFAGFPYYVVPPATRCRYATGKGNSPKDQVLAAVIKRYGDVEVVGNDEADALIIAAMGARHAGQPIEASLPETHLKAMEGVQW